MVRYSLLGLAEPLSSLSHLAGAVAFAALAPWLLRRAGRVSPVGVGVVGLYCVSVVALLSTSGLYHAFAAGSAGRAVLRRLDHIAIFLLIAATFTPPHVLLFRGPWRWVPLAVVWLGAAAGSVLKLAFFSWVEAWWSTLIYIALGWVGLAGGLRLWRLRGWNVVEPLFWGAVAFSLGALIDLDGSWTVIPGVLGAHELFHLAALVGIALHWRFIHLVCSPQTENAYEPALACDNIAA